jgi:hypothetical protein
VQIPTEGVTKKRDPTSPASGMPGGFPTTPQNVS